MNTAIVNSYYRSIKRGTRTLAQVPEALRDAVRAMLEADAA